MVARSLEEAQFSDHGLFSYAWIDNLSLDQHIRNLTDLKKAMEDLKEEIHASS